MMKEVLAKLQLDEHYYGDFGKQWLSNSDIITLLNDPKSFGLLTANSWFITKHAAVIMSSQPSRTYEKIKNSVEQKKINQKAITNFTENPEGNGKIDTYTVINARKGPEFALIIGTLENGWRFVANSEKDNFLLEKMMKEEMLEAKVSVSKKEGKNIFNLI